MGGDGCVEIVGVPGVSFPEREGSGRDTWDTGCLVWLAWVRLSELREVVVALSWSPARFRVGIWTCGGLGPVTRSGLERTTSESTAAYRRQTGCLEALVAPLCWRPDIGPVRGPRSMQSVTRRWC